jgi:cell division protein ZipA
VESFAWILVLISIAVLILIYAYSTSKISWRFKLPKKGVAARTEPVPDADDAAKAAPAEAAGARQVPRPPRLEADSKVVTVRIVPHGHGRFPAERLVLALRGEGFQHGEFDIFHKHDPFGSGRIRYSVASLVEPGAFDLSKLKDSEYPGISMFMVLPAPEDGLALFDEMMACAHRLEKELGGRLVDEQGSLFSVQRERYMREEVIEFLRQQLRVTDQDDLFEIGGR